MEKGECVLFPFIMHIPTSAISSFSHQEMQWNATSPPIESLQVWQMCLLYIIWGEALYTIFLWCVSFPVAHSLVCSDFDFIYWYKDIRVPEKPRMLSYPMEEGTCAGLYKNGPHRLIHFNTQGVAFSWKELGGLASLESGWPSWKKCITRGGLWGFKTVSQSQCLQCLALSAAYRPIYRTLNCFPSTMSACLHATVLLLWWEWTEPLKL